MRNTSKSQSSSDRLSTGSKSHRDYEVGYKKPPVKSRFQKGQSGNPHGRPTGSKSHKLNDEKTLAEVFREESKRIVNLQQGGQVTNLTSEQAVVRSMIGRAIQGNPSAQRAFISLQSKPNAPSDDTWNEKLAIVVAYKNGWRQFLDEQKRGGKVSLRPDPAPERIEIDEDNRVAYLVEALPRDAKAKRCQQLSRRKLGAEDYDWLMRNTPSSSDAEDMQPQKILSHEDIERLPEHIKARFMAGLQGLKDYSEGKFVCIVPPHAIYDSEYVTPCGHKMPLRGMRSYPVEREDAEILLTQGWSLYDPDE